MASEGGFVYLVYEAGNFRLALDVSLELRARGVGAPVLFSPYWLPETPRYVAEARAQGIPYVHEVTALGGWADPLAQLREQGFECAAASEAQAQATKGRRRDRLAAALLRLRGPQLSGWEEHYRDRIARATRFLGLTRARAVILPEDNVERDSACWTRAMHALGGPVAVISYGAMNPLEAAIAYADNPEHHIDGARKRLFAAIYPKWRTTYQGRAMLRLPMPRAFALERLGLAPRNPWIVNTGEVDAIVVESPYMKERFVKHGIAARKIHPIGHAGLDSLARAMQRRDEIRASWAAGHGYDGTRPVLLCAMPPDQYPALRVPEFATYEALVDGWLQGLDAMRASYFPVISPHPNLAPGIRSRMREAGFAVLEGGVAQWLPACDLYAASVSGTIKWALACGKPVVNYDCYAYGHDDFMGIGSVVHAAAYKDFRAALERFREPAHARKMSRQAEAGRDFFGTLDGRSCERIAQLLRGGLRPASA